MVQHKRLVAVGLLVLGALLSVRVFAPAAAAAPAPGYGDIQSYPSPDGGWTAIFNQSDGSLRLRAADGRDISVFAPGSTVYAVSWSPDSRRLLAVRSNWTQTATLRKQGTTADGAVQGGGPIQIWQVEFLAGNPAPSRSVCPDVTAAADGPVFCLFQSPAPADQGPEQIILGRWSPDSRRIVFWRGPLSASVATDGLPAYVLDATDGQAAVLADLALLNRHYHSWAPGGSALVMTAGGFRSALTGKWLSRYDIASQQSTTMISQTEQIPGMLAWSPDGQWVAYAAVDAGQVNPDTAYQATWDNPAVAGRRIYLMTPGNGRHVRVNDGETFQDAPLWSEDGATLYYVERQGQELVLMAFDVKTGQAQPVPGARQALPEVAGYYGQLDVDALLACRPAPTATPTPGRCG